jgi:hypothetical protein
LRRPLVLRALAPWLRNIYGGDPAIRVHQVALGATAVEPRVAEVMPESVREYLDAVLAPTTGDDLLNPAGSSE